MAEVISAEEGAMRAGAQAVAQAKADIDVQTKKVRSEISAMSGIWKGQAASSYATMMSQWDAQVKKLGDVLIRLEEGLQATERDQVATEEAQSATIKGLSGMMNG